MIKPKIMLVIDEFGWTFHNHALQISQRLSDEYDFKIVDSKYNVKRHENNFDVFFILDPIPLEHGYPSPKRTIISLRCQFLYEQHPQGAKGLYFGGFPGRCVSIDDKCSLFVVLNKNQLETFDFVGNKLEKISHGVDESIFDKEKYSVFKERSGESIGVGLVGRNSANKRFDVVKSVIKNVNDVEWREAEYSKNKIPFKQMPLFYKSIDVLICMSKSEAVNNPILEAGAMGVPVISTRCGAAEEIIEHSVNGILVNDKKDLKVAINAVKDKEYRKIMGENLYDEIISRWTWGVKIHEYKAMFNKMISMNS